MHEVMPPELIAVLFWYMGALPPGCPRRGNGRDPRLEAGDSVLPRRRVCVGRHSLRIPCALLQGLDESDGREH
jgi:hypothetical protein